MIIKPLEVEKDYDMIASWCIGRSTCTPKHLLHTNGFVVYDNDKPIMSFFLILTDSKVCIIDDITGNPDSTWEQREDAVLWLTKFCEIYARKLGFKFIRACPSKKRLAEKFDLSGFNFYPTQVYLCEKEIR